MVNFLAVVVVSVINMIVGAVWYSNSFFGKAWLKATKISPKDIEKAKKSGQTSKAYFLMFLAAVLSNLILAWLIFYTGLSTATSGASLAFLVWLGFLATTSLGEKLFSNKPWSLYFINNGHQLIGLLISGVVLAVWI